MSAAARAPVAAAHTARTRGEAWRVFARHGSPRVLMASLAVAGAARLAVGDFAALDLVPLAALLAIWPLQEWLIHVFVLHYRPRRARGRTFDFRVPRDHRAHHRDPWNPELLFIKKVNGTVRDVFATEDYIYAVNGFGLIVEPVLKPLANVAE